MNMENAMTYHNINDVYFTKCILLLQKKVLPRVLHAAIMIETVCIEKSEEGKVADYQVSVDVRGNDMDTPR